MTIATKHRNRFRIAVVSTSFPPHTSGGVETSHFNLLNAFRSRGYDAKGFTFCDPICGENEEVIRRGLPKSVALIIRSGLFAALRFSGDRGVIYQAADTLICSLGAISLIRKLRTFSPDVTIIPDLGAPAAFWPDLGGKTILIAHHNPLRFLGQPLFGGHSAKDAHLALRLERLALKRVDAVVCPSRYMTKIFAETYPFRGPVHVIPNMVDSKAIDTAPESRLHAMMGLAAGLPIVYIPSAGSVYKGSRFVFELIRRISRGVEEEIGFYLSGNLDPALVECLHTVPGNARIYAPGHISYRDNVDAVKQCSICLSPTLAENFGMAILEAQYLGLPVVTFDVGGNSEIVSLGSTGFLAPFLHVDELVENTLRLLREPELMRDMGETAKRETHRLFNQDVVIDRFLELFEMLDVGRGEGVSA